MNYTEIVFFFNVKGGVYNGFWFFPLWISRRWQMPAGVALAQNVFLKIKGKSSLSVFYSRRLIAIKCSQYSVSSVQYLPTYYFYLALKRDINRHRWALLRSIESCTQMCIIIYVGPRVWLKTNVIDVLLLVAARHEDVYSDRYSQTLQIHSGMIKKKKKNLGMDLYREKKIVIIFPILGIL